MRITLGESPAGVAKHFHHDAAVSACWEVAVILCIDQAAAAGKDKMVVSSFRREGKRREEAPASQSHQRSDQTHLTYSQTVKGLSC